MQDFSLKASGKTKTEHYVRIANKAKDPSQKSDIKSRTQFLGSADYNVW